MQNRRGSALLIVLGMLAFMVISAVAFSAYMRSSRLPSSFLRRTVSSRMLVKAALAEAIDEIDAAIGNNPHPGVGTQNSCYPRNDSGSGYNRNKWIGRVYIGATNSSQSTRSPAECLVGQNETVSPLCLEALAYIPPPLVNEARYYSRRSQAAKWHSFPYDVGRYAFCAIDVSDFLDVNALLADTARSSAPDTRLSFAYLFENDKHTSTSGDMGKPEEWEKFMDNYRGSGKLPLVSMADWNLAIHNAGLSGWTSPFCRYVENGPGNFYDTDPTSPEAEQIRRMVFVTDGWMPNTNEVGQTGDLAVKQPFPDISAGDSDASQPSVPAILSGTSETRKLLEENMSMLDIVSLYDYLDKNDVPASLALPTVERVPMLVGMQPSFSITVTPKVKMTVGASLAGHNPPNVIHQEEIYEYSIDINSGGPNMVAGAWMFPFLRGKAYPGGFTPEFAVRIGFVDTSSGLPSGNRVNNSGNNCGFVISALSDFSVDGSVANGAFKLFKSASLNFPSPIREETDAIALPTPANFNVASLNAWASGPNGILFTVKREVYKQVPAGAPPGSPPVPVPGYPMVIGVTVNPDMYPVERDLITPSALAADLQSPTPAGIPTTLYMSITARVKKNESTVDLVPASYIDDINYNSVASSPSIGNLNGGVSSYPLMLFGDTTGANSLNFSEAAFGYNPNMSPGSVGGSPITFTIAPSGGTSVFCPDPRWNFAPENFMLSNDSIANIKNYYKNNKSKVGLGVDGRDRDIFMNVSNVKWMQSPSELAFLPRTAIDMGGGSPDMGNAKTLLTAKLGTGFQTAFNDLAHADLMWRTYRLYETDSNPDKGGRDGIYDIGLYNSAFGFKVSPFSNCTNVFMAAFANTPYSWWAASIGNLDCENDDVDDSAAKPETFNSKYAFSGMNNDAKFDWQDLTRVAGNIMGTMRDAGFDWQRAYDEMDWAGLNHDLCGWDFTGDTTDLYEIDRKMLFGFWRDCFAAQQQLFLVFVRAEPMMMGGGAAHQTPPQLGARAMALVWRDPTPVTGTGNNPAHKTRILFYRQFE